MTATKNLKHLLIPYLEENAKKKGKKYICPLCGSGLGNNGKGTPAFNIAPPNKPCQNQAA